ncbi:Transcription factor [Penicillium atrosanguineum]|uniref:Transcription factor n=1 Tax=Penicillium atrosanguineum TaxID=1132637 RepID=UPI002399171C|nr:Transcription factor [Penicillium atrosanguineum]KAJ5298835.1 Transcription factor [Penicillium atrosanguineum]
MAGRAETRTPEPPDRDEHEKSPPRVLRPRRTTRPPYNYGQEQEIDIQQINARSQQQQKKKTLGKLVTQRETVTSDSSTESEDPNASELIQELVKLRKEIKLRYELHKEELRKAKEESSAALAEVRHELQILTDRLLVPQPETGIDDILREIQTLNDVISTPALIGSLSYADIARTPPLSHPSNI